nr:DUF3320 domain-containing protein [Roseibium sp. RKSG952]
MLIPLAEATSAEPETNESATAHLFQRGNLSGYTAEPDRFYEISYTPTIQAMINTILEAEAPKRDDVLAQRVARAHGWLRTGASIRAHVERHTRNIETSEEGGRFLWRDGQQREVLRYRHHATEDDRRPVSDIAFVELAAFVREHQDILLSDDPGLAFARSIGLNRLAAASRARLEKAIEMASDADVAKGEGGNDLD